MIKVYLQKRSIVIINIAIPWFFQWAINILQRSSGCEQSKHHKIIKRSASVTNSIGRKQKAKHISPALERKCRWPRFHINHICQMWQTEPPIEILLELLLPVRIREVQFGVIHDRGSDDQLTCCSWFLFISNTSKAIPAGHSKTTEVPLTRSDCASIVHWRC